MTSFLFTPSRLLAALLAFGAALSPAAVHAAGEKRHAPEPPQETGFLNRRIELHGVIYRFQVYLPEEFRRDARKPWPVILFLHGRGERGSEGLWQTQIGLPQALRDHPERWPFVVVMPQCPLGNYWTDPEMLAMATAALDQETAEFHLDAERTYLTGLSLGGYGAWELARQQPHRWAAVAIAAGGVFWSYAPERWQQAATLPAEYARAIGRLPLWLFHGTDDTTVLPRQSELMYEAVKAAGGRIRLWLYQGLKHDSWTRAYLEPDLPRWLLSHHLDSHPRPDPPFAERIVVPLHPPAIKLTPAQLDALSGDYRDSRGHLAATIYHQGELIFEKNAQGESMELAAESPALLFYPNGSSISRIAIERDPQGRITALIFHDDRHDERWEKRPAVSSR